MKQWEKLQHYVAERLKKWDPEARPTKASGGSTELGDVSNTMFMVECKQRDKIHPVIDVHVWAKNKAELPLESEKIPLLVLENTAEQRFAVMEADYFFDMIDDFFSILEDMEQRIQNSEGK